MNLMPKSIDFLTAPKHVIMIGFLGATIPPAAGGARVVRRLSRSDKISTKTLPTLQEVELEILY